MAATSSPSSPLYHPDESEDCSGFQLRDDEVEMTFSFGMFDGMFDVVFEPGRNEDLFVSAFIAFYKTNTAKLDLGTVADEMGEDGFRRLLREMGTRSRMLRCVSLRARSGSMKTYVLPLLLPFLSSLPNLQEFKIKDNLNPSSINYLLSVAQHPTLRHLHLDHASLHGDTSILLLLRFLVDYFQTGSDLNRLSLILQDVHPSELYIYLEIPALLLEMIKPGRGSSLEYLSVKWNKLFVASAEFLQLVCEVAEGTKTVQDVHLQSPTRLVLFEGDIGRNGRLKDALVRNRRLRTQTHSAALSLLPIFRTLLLDPTTSIQPRFRILPPRTTTIASLPVELLRRILVELNTSPLSRKQVVNLLAYAEDRRTLAGRGEWREGSREFLRDVDCWKYDG